MKLKINVTGPSNVSSSTCERTDVIHCMPDEFAKLLGIELYDIQTSGYRFVTDPVYQACMKKLLSLNGKIAKTTYTTLYEDEVTDAATGEIILTIKVAIKP